MGTCLGARIASSLSSRVKSERLIGWPSISPRLLRLFGGAFQFRHAGLDVLNLDSLGPMRQDQVGGPQLRGRRCVLVQHDLQDGGNRCTGRLLESRRALVELGFLHPSQQRVDPNTRRAGSFLHAAVRQQGRDGLLLLASEFGAVSYHLHPMHPPGPGQAPHPRFFAPVDLFQKRLYFQVLPSDGCDDRAERGTKEIQNDVYNRFRQTRSRRMAPPRRPPPQPQPLSIPSPARRNWWNWPKRGRRSDWSRFLTA